MFIKSVFVFLALIACYIIVVDAASKALTIPQYISAASALGLKKLATLKAVDTVCFQR